MLAQPTDLHVQLLGSFRVWVGQCQIDTDQWHLRKAKNLVKLLALTSDHRLHRDQLTELLWPQLEPKGAANNFYQTLFAARRVFKENGIDPQPYLQLQEESLRLCPEAPLWVDVEAFEKATALARRNQTPALYQAALDLYAGELLPEDRYEDWAINRRRDLHQLHLRLLYGLANAYETRKMYHPAIETLQLVLKYDYTDGEAHTGLMRLYALSEQRPKALLQYRRFKEVLASELGIGPDRQAVLLYQDILAGNYPPQEDNLRSPVRQAALRAEPAEVGRQMHNLPTQLTSFVGRDQEKARILEALTPTTGRRARLLTLIGPGGCGKTRLALEAAGDLIGAFSGGIWQVELASLSDAAFLPQAIAKALDLQEAAGKPLFDTLVASLQDQQVLLVLDNCEHLIEACAHLAEKLLQSCAHLCILATSREALGVAGEVIFRVSPLSLPDLHNLLPLKSLIKTESVQLFLERARAAQPGFNLTNDNALAVATVCHRLDGIPLAIELAAAQVRTLQVRQMAIRLEQRFDLLGSSLRLSLPHHQTLTASFEWSYDLLTPEERQLFRRLSVFTGGWWLEAAEVVAGFNSSGPPAIEPFNATRAGTLPDEQSGSQPASEPIAPRNVLHNLVQLANKSMVVTVFDATSETRYHMLETIRQYSLGKLIASGEEEQVRDQHLEYYLQLVKQAAQVLRGPDQVSWLYRLESDLDNLRTALAWALRRAESSARLARSPVTAPERAVEAGLQLATALGQFWHLRSLPSEGVRWLERVLAAEAQERAGALLPERALLRARALFTAGWLASYLEDMEKVETRSEESLAILRQLGPQGRHDAAYVLINLAELARKQGDYPRERVLIEESMAIFRERDDKFGIADIINNFLGVMTMMEGDYARARSLQQEALALRQEIGDQDGIALSLTQLGWVALCQGNYPQAVEFCQASLAHFEELGNRYGACRALYLLGSIAVATGDYTRARAYFHEALDVAQDMDHKHGMCYAWIGLGYVAYIQANLRGAQVCFAEALDLLDEIKDRWLIALLVCAVGHLAAAGDQAELAIRLCAAAQDMFDLIRFTLAPGERAAHDADVDRLRATLGEAYQAAWEAGHALDLDSAVQLARDYIKSLNPSNNR